jgi:hypothetical protein
MGGKLSAKNFRRDDQPKRMIPASALEGQSSAHFPPRKIFSTIPAPPIYNSREACFGLDSRAKRFA